MNPFQDTHNDTVFIEKSDGSRIGPYKTKVGKESASIFESNIDVIEGDKLVRSLPTGKEESFLITLAHFSQGLHLIPAHFKLQLKKVTATPYMTPPKHNIININNSTGIQVGDNNVLNIQNAINELVQKIDNANSSHQEKDEAKSRLSAFLSHPLVIAILGGVSGSIS